jgi:hypothetical protein
MTKQVRLVMAMRKQQRREGVTNFSMSVLKILRVCLIGLAALAFLSSGVEAKTISISGTHSPADVQSHCAAAHGHYRQDDNGYGCYTANGSVDCNPDNHKCNGKCDSCGAIEASASMGGFFGRLLLGGGFSLATQGQN